MREYTQTVLLLFWGGIGFFVCLFVFLVFFSFSFFVVVVLCCFFSFFFFFSFFPLSLFLQDL